MGVLDHKKKAVLTRPSTNSSVSSILKTQM